MKQTGVMRQVWSAQRRILIVAAYAPPFAPFGATRIPALARFWHSRGADVRIIAAHSRQFAPMGDFPIAPDNIRHVRFPANREPVPLLPDAAEPEPLAAAKAWIARKSPRLMDRLRKVSLDWHNIRLVPDSYMPWVKPAISEALAWCADWRPDLIYSSGPPHSAHLVAARLAEKWPARWIAEMRDPWSQNPYLNRSGIAVWINSVIERRVLSGASALVAMTQAQRDTILCHNRVPIAVVRNGFEIADLELMDRQVRTLTDEPTITIVHAGCLYEGRRDPGFLLEALKLLGDDARHFRIRIIGEPDVSGKLTENYGAFQSQFEHLPRLPREDVLKYYAQSDVLLLMRWNSPQENNFVAGKLFEYIAARRPILCLGNHRGEAADLVRDNGFGIVAQSAEEAAFALRGWLETKRRLRQVPELPREPTLPFSREVQFEQLDMFIGALGVNA